MTLDLFQIAANCVNNVKKWWHYYATKIYPSNSPILPERLSSTCSITTSLFSSLAILAALPPSSLTGDVSLREREACRGAGLSSCEVLGVGASVMPVEYGVGTASRGLEADLPAEVLEAP
jgi:hypothetical protein